jgi:hypothetical protein
MTAVSICCHAEIKAYMPRVTFYTQSPPDPIPYCTECGAKNPEEIELEPQPCYFCEGQGWIWSHEKKRTCPICHGKGEEEGE